MVPVLGLAPNNFLEPVMVLISAPVPVLVPRSTSSFALGFISNSAARFVCEARIAMEFDRGAPSPAHHREEGHEVFKLLLLQCAARAKIYQAETLGAEICIASTSYHNSRAKDIQILRKSI